MRGAYLPVPKPGSTPGTPSPRAPLPVDSTAPSAVERVEVTQAAAGTEVEPQMQYGHVGRVGGHHFAEEQGEEQPGIRMAEMPGGPVPRRQTVQPGGVRCLPRRVDPYPIGQLDQQVEQLAQRHGTERWEPARPGVAPAGAEREPARARRRGADRLPDPPGAQRNQLRR